MFYEFVFKLMIQKCQCCLDSGTANAGCGNGGGKAAPICATYGSNKAGTGQGTCALINKGTKTNYDSFVSDSLILELEILLRGRIQRFAKDIMAGDPFCSQISI